MSETTRTAAERALAALEHTMLGTWETEILPPANTHVLCFCPLLLDAVDVDQVIPAEMRSEVNPQDDAEMAGAYSELFALSIRPGVLTVENGEHVWSVLGETVSVGSVLAWLRPIPQLPGCIAEIQSAVDQALDEDDQPTFFFYDGEDLLEVPGGLPALGDDAETPLNTLSEAHADELGTDTTHAAIVGVRTAGGNSVLRTQIGSDEYERLRDASEDELRNAEFLASCGALTYTVLPTVRDVYSVRVLESEKDTGERTRLLYEEKAQHATVH